MTGESTWRVEIDRFSGPLDLLLHLLREEEISPQDVQVARVCDRFLEHLEHLDRIDVDHAGEFLVMASILMRLKSRSLLPDEDKLLEDDDLDPRFELVRQLIEYRRFKTVAERLDERREEAALRFRRGMHPEIRENAPAPVADGPVDGATVEALFAAFGRLLRETQIGSGYTVTRDDTPIEGHMDRLEALLAPGTRMLFDDLFAGRRTKPYMIGTFLALLELLKRGRIDVHQEGEFGAIVVEGREPPPESPRATEAAAPAPPAGDAETQA